MVQRPPSTTARLSSPEPALDPGASRRLFLTGSGAAALAATAGATTAWNLGTPRELADTDAASVAAEGTVVAYIRPGETEVTVMSEDRQVVVDDPALVRAIVRALGGR